MNKKITTVIILIIICASSIIVSILYLIKNDIIDINDIYTNADAKNTQVANGSNISSQKIQRWAQKVVFCLRKVLNTILCTTIEQAFMLN